MNILRKNKNALFLGMSLVLLGLSALLIFISRQSAGFSLWYGRNIFPVFVITMGRVFSLLPFSVFEMLIYLVIPAVLYWGFRLFKNPGSRGQILYRFLQRILLVLSVLLLLFTLTAGINYGKPALLDQVHADSNGQYSEDELIALFQILVEDAGRTAEANTPSQATGTGQPAEAQAAMKNLAQRFPELSGYYPNPKPVLFSKGMSYLGITGIYSPFTLEANYNVDIPAYLIPFTMCHELAHLKGFMPEEEANFIAYLACRDSSSIEFQYSGAVNALSYTLGALYKTVDPDLYQELIAEIPQPVRLELINNQAYWKAHRKKITEISTKANDSYLKANAQSAGVKSYGLMVELLLEEYRLIPDASLPSQE